MLWNGQSHLIKPELSDISNAPYNDLKNELIWFQKALFLVSNGFLVTAALETI